MKTFTFHAVALSFGLVCAGTASAATEASLGVTATLAPEACNLALINGGIFNLGKIDSNRVSRTGTTLLPPIETPFRITCTAPAAFALRLGSRDIASRVLLDLPDYNGRIHDRAEVVNGLGYSNGHKIGGYIVEVNEAARNPGTGFPYNVLTSFFGGWLPNISKRLSENYMVGFGNTTTPGGVPDLMGVIRVSAGIAHDQGMTFEDEIEINGQSTLELVYL
ncbi:DUF1120 domain-containing protein [Pseudomonas sp. dw_358]|uniref:DUF1120 domain-containing protein n=1 Tax=Pseudomonas sp. dw_358 TaxID=2720083 RepID=UPI001BD1CE06|nr:DUF1120 domain-containing protein [Pseudomonas sp. dw_358]